jgi:hypothetical protein
MCGKMGDIEGRIIQWRLSMPRLLPGRGEVLDELEGHLRDDVDAPTRGGHPPDEAVEMAMNRLGRPDDIAGEFAKLPAAPAPWLPVRLA